MSAAEGSRQGKDNIYSCEDMIVAKTEKLE
jgi:hypothetical protein